MKISQPNSLPLITHRRTQEYTYECSAIHKGKIWSLSLAICDLINEGPQCCLVLGGVSRYAFITQSICILTHSLQDMHLYQSAALNQNPSVFEVGFNKKVCLSLMCVLLSRAVFGLLIKWENFSSRLWIYHKIINNSSEDILGIYE